jgi:hypothetical protein
MYSTNDIPTATPHYIQQPKAGVNLSSSNKPNEEKAFRHYYGSHEINLVHTFDRAVIRQQEVPVTTVTERSRQIEQINMNKNDQIDSVHKQKAKKIATKRGWEAAKKEREHLREQLRNEKFAQDGFGDRLSDCELWEHLSEADLRIQLEEEERIELKNQRIEEDEMAIDALMNILIDELSRDAECEVVDESEEIEIFDESAEELIIEEPKEYKIELPCTNIELVFQRSLSIYGKNDYLKIDDDESDNDDCYLDKSDSRALQYYDQNQYI